MVDRIKEIREISSVFNNRKEKNMNSLLRKIDEYYNSKGMTIYPAGSCYKSSDHFEIYSGNLIIPENFEEIRTIDSVFEDPNFKEWVRKNEN